MLELLALAFERSRLIHELAFQAACLGAQGFEFGLAFDQARRARRQALQTRSQGGGPLLRGAFPPARSCAAADRAPARGEKRAIGRARRWRARRSARWSPRRRASRRWPRAPSPREDFELRVVRGDDHPRTGREQRFDESLSEGGARDRLRAAADLIDEHQASAGGATQRRAQRFEMRRKRRQVLRDRLLVAHTRTRCDRTSRSRCRATPEAERPSTRAGRTDPSS